MALLLDPATPYSPRSPAFLTADAVLPVVIPLIKLDASLTIGHDLAPNSTLLRAFFLSYDVALLKDWLILAESVPT